MARYFFHIHNGDDLLDDEGVKLHSDEAAKSEAIDTAGSMLRDMRLSVWTVSQWRMTVVCGEKVICILRFSSNGAGESWPPLAHTA
jgi:hypothetical protein